MDSALAQLSNIVAGAVVGVQGVEDKAASDERTLVESLDGWTLEIAGPPIKVKLSGPLK